MNKSKKFFSLGLKMYIFVICMVILVALGTTIIAYTISANQIDRYYKRLSEDNARNFASLVDADYLAELRKVAESDEFRQLRERAEANEDEEIIRVYLEQRGLLEKYVETRDRITTYLANMRDILYLYTIVPGGVDAVKDMYLVDDGDTPLLNLGFYEDREPEFYGLDLEHLEEPTVSHGDWGWLCSAYAPVYASDGSFVCVVGCDFGMDEVVSQRYQFFAYIVVGTLVFIGVMLAAAVHIVNETVVKPLKTLISRTKEFAPDKHKNYTEAGVIDLRLRSHDEISDLYDSIRSMQTDIVDYLNDLEDAEEDIRAKNEQIGVISEAAYRDPLTGVGSKAAYIKKTEEINRDISEGKTELAVAMIDVNNLKRINDGHGHKAGDSYINGCSRMICDVFKHSPVYRVGGDEFVAILRGVDYEARYELIGKLKQRYAYTYSREDQQPWRRYSAAVGMAELAPGDETLDVVFKRADKEMYEDKKRCKSERK